MHTCGQNKLHVTSSAEYVSQCSEDHRGDEVTEEFGSIDHAPPSEDAALDLVVPRELILQVDLAEINDQLIQLPARSILDRALHAISPQVCLVFPSIMLKRRNIP